MSNALNSLAMLQTITRFKSVAADSVKRNCLTDQYHRGRAVVVKRRNTVARKISELTNFYFRLARIPIAFCTDTQTWQRWEVSCYRMLNEHFRAFALGEQKICEDKLPGQSLWSHMRDGTLSRRMIEAGAQEFRRAHSMWSDEFNGPWSHGDATMENVIYDDLADCARLIDFEILHDKSLSAEARHADDLLVFLLDLVGHVSRRRWLPLALCFVRTYGDPKVTQELLKRLTPPHGLARIWWHVRSNFKGTKMITCRFEQLRRALERDATKRDAAT
jgi:hypothetical protein